MQQKLPDPTSQLCSSFFKFPEDICIFSSNLSSTPVSIEKNIAQRDAQERNH